VEPFFAMLEPCSDFLFGKDAVGSQPCSQINWSVFSHDYLEALEYRADIIQTDVAEKLSPLLI